MDDIWRLYKEFGWMQLADWFEKNTVYRDKRELRKVEEAIGSLSENCLDELAEHFLEFRAAWVICMKYGLDLEFKYRSVVAYRQAVLIALSGAYDDDD